MKILNKKAAFQLSINAIVILILSIVFLGLALAFVSNIFGTMNETFEEGFDSITSQRINQLKTSEKNFDIEAYTAEIAPGGRDIMFMLLRSSTGGDWAITGTTGSSLGSDATACDDVTVSLKSTIDMPADTELVPPLLIEVDSGVTKDTTCLFELRAAHGSVTDAVELTINVI